MRWNSKKIKFREHTFLDNANVPAALKEGTLTLTVAAAGAAAAPSSSPRRLELPYGTPLAAVKALVLRHNPAVRVIKVSNLHLRRLCRWLGSAAQNAAFNKLIKYILTESSRYCPEEDHGKYGGLGNWNWQVTARVRLGVANPNPYPNSDPNPNPNPTPTPTPTPPLPLTLIPPLTLARCAWSSTRASGAPPPTLTPS